MSSSTKPPRAPRTREVGTGEQIVNQAVKLFAENGCANTSLNDIATAVGIKKPSLYHYIRTKEDLVYEIERMLVEEVHAELSEMLSIASTPMRSPAPSFAAFLG